MRVEPFIHFSGKCERAMKFYEQALGGKITAMMRFDQMPPEGGGPAREMPPGDHIMYSRLDFGDTVLMASDGFPVQDKPTGFASFELCYSSQDEADADRVFAALSNGGKVRMPLMKTFFSPRYGQLTDQFGVQWMVLVPMVM